MTRRPDLGLIGAAACRALVVVAVVLSAAISSTEAEEPDALWAALRAGSAFAMMRHALAPGIGDPVNFDVNDCATQRNLSEDGRRQAAAVGDRFRDHGIGGATVMSSAWCRCLETAEELALGPVAVLPALNSFFRDPQRREAQTAALQAWLSREHGGKPLILVTHQVNISALTGAYTRSGEIVVAKLATDGAITVLGILQ
ncbi:MAG: histidine phosphatase family protein [Rhodospirillales bacterium]|nr:histidine phosphatase family protein [Rhodospirillales bacterium]